MSDFKALFKEQGLKGCRKMWRDRGELGKFHNLVIYVMVSGKRSELFIALQVTENIGKVVGKQWKLVLDRGIRWNVIYSMIRHALELKQALNTYALQLRSSSNTLDNEMYKEDFLTESE
jgi:hypothetical protein